MSIVIEKFNKRVVYTVKDTNEFLKSHIKPIIEDKELLLNGKDLGGLNLKPREILGLFLLMAIANKNSIGIQWTISSDPESADGDGALILDTGKHRVGYLIESIVVTDHQSEVELNTAICNAIDKKNNKGEAYTEGRNLIVLVLRTGKIKAKEVLETVQNNHYKNIYIVQKKEKKLNRYNIINAEKEVDNVLFHYFQVKIKETFNGYKVWDQVKDSLKEQITVDEINNQLYSPSRLNDFSDSVKYPRKELNIVKDLHLYLKEYISPFLQDYKALVNGKPIDNEIKLRPREIFCLIICCLITRFTFNEEEWTVAEDPEEGDGAVYIERNGHGYSFLIEQTYINQDFSSDAELENSIISSIEKKINKAGKSYMENRDLVVLIDYGGTINADNLRVYFQNHTVNIYNHLWLIGFNGNNLDTTTVLIHKNMENKPKDIPAVTYSIKFTDDLSNWEVKEI